MISKLFNKKTKFEWSFSTRDLSLELLSGWVHDGEMTDPLTFFKETDGVGAIQISIATSKSGELPDMQEHFKMNNIDQQKVKKYDIGDWIVYEYDETKDGNSIKNFNLVMINVHVYATYISRIEHTSKKEINEATNIIHSIRVFERSEESPFFDESYADSLIGKHVIVGYTHKNKKGKVVKQEQKHGRVLRVNSSEGVVIKQHNSDTTFSLPPDFRTWEKAKLGEYRLRSTGEVVVNPDYLTNWIKDVE